MFILYDIVFFIYSAVYLPYLLLSGRWHSDFFQRFGIFPKETKARLGHARNIWIHAVSVGEVMAVQGFIQLLKNRWPGIGIVCSVTTKTGYEVAKKQLGTTACVICAPLDFSFVAAKFVRLIQPKFYIAAETELWPNLFGQLHQAKIPMAVINGRISDRSFGRYQAIRFALKPVLQKVNVFAMQSEPDADRIRQLGANPSRVWTTGNIKFDDLPATGDGQLHAAGFMPQTKLWIAGSTHPGEETILLNVFRKLRLEFPLWQLVLAPRHIERVPEILAQVKAAGCTAIKFSELRGRIDPDPVIVVDTLGHLRTLYAQASLVFVGKSLCVGGGHNVIEPAFFSKPIVVGPRTENFRDVVSFFKKQEAIVEVQNAGELMVAAQGLLGDEIKRLNLGRRARAVVDQNQGAAIRTLKLIEQCL